MKGYKYFISVLNNDDYYIVQRLCKTKKEAINHANQYFKRRDAWIVEIKSKGKTIYKKKK